MWLPDEPGVVTLPDGRRVRGRSLRVIADGASQPDWALYLLGARPPPTPWPHRWVKWGDFRTPSDTRDAADALAEAHRRAAAERVEIACAGGVGRTGTALAALLVLQGTPVDEAILAVRASYHRRAVETPWQRRWLVRIETGRF